MYNPDYKNFVTILLRLLVFNQWNITKNVHYNDMTRTIIRVTPCASCPIPVKFFVLPADVCAHSLGHVCYFLLLHMGTEPTPGFAEVTPNIVKNNGVKFVIYEY
jgi:hypothetical protein